MKKPCSPREFSLGDTVELDATSQFQALSDKLKGVTWHEAKSKHQSKMQHSKYGVGYDVRIVCRTQDSLYRFSETRGATRFSQTQLLTFHMWRNCPWRKNESSFPRQISERLRKSCRSCLGSLILGIRALNKGRHWGVLV